MSIFKKRSNILTLLSILMVSTLLRLPTLFEPWGGDQGVYGFISKGILDGNVPYRDMYTSTGYGIFFIYAFLFKIFGTNMWALHVGDFLAVSLSIILIYTFSRKLFGVETAVLAGAMAALFASGSAFSGMYDLKGAWGTYWQLAQRETFMLPIITAAIIIAVNAEQRKNCYSHFWVGLFMGAAVIIKFTAVLMTGFFILFYIYAGFNPSDGDGIKKILLKSVSLLAGFIVIQIPFLIYFWVNESLYAMYKAIFVHTSIYAGLSRGNLIAAAFQGNAFILRENMILWLFSAVSSAWLLFRSRKKEDVLLVMWALGTLLMVWGQGKFFGYHYILIIAPFSVLAGFGIVRFLKIQPSWRKSIWDARKNIGLTFMWLMIGANLLAFLIINYEYYKYHALYLSNHMSKEAYYEIFNEYPLHLYSFRADNDVAEYLKENAEKSATVRTINGGGDTIIHFLTGLESPTRFTSTWYLFNPYLYRKPITTSLRKELITGIKEEKPDYLLLIFYNMEEFREQYSGPEYEDVNILMDYISKNYVLEKTFQDRRILYKKL